MRIEDLVLITEDGCEILNSFSKELDIVEEYGADTLRTYVLFMGDYGAATPWSENSVKGCKKFLDRVAGLTDILLKNPYLMNWR